MVKRFTCKSNIMASNISLLIVIAKYGKSLPKCPPPPPLVL